MANAIYTKAKEKFLSGSINLTSDTIKAAIIDAQDYTVDTDTHEFKSSVATAAIVAEGTIANVTVTNGEFDGDNVVMSNVTGDQCEAVIIYKDTGSSATSPLICYIDTATGLPITPNGGDITLDWDDANDYIFKL